MSHQPQRLEKDCLNCGTIVAGKYCQVCGQENIIPKQSAWALIKHFIFDVLHFDGKFFETLKFLLIKPGFVPEQVMQGKRISYLDPIRMYLFTSAIFFLIFFSVSESPINISSFRSLSKVQRFDQAAELAADSLRRHDSAVARIRDSLLNPEYQANVSLLKDSSHAGEPNVVKVKRGWYRLSFGMISPDTATNSKDLSLLKRKSKSWEHEIQNKYEGSEEQFLKDTGDKILHKMPYMLFVSLPFFALILKLLYIRRKEFYYSGHAVFTLYHYIFTFILTLVTFLFSYLRNVTGWQIFKWMIIALLLSGGVYLYLGMKRFYKQSWGRTLGKFVLLNLLGIVITTALVVAFVALSIF